MLWAGGQGAQKKGAGTRTVYPRDGVIPVPPPRPADVAGVGRGSIGRGVKSLYDLSSYVVFHF